MNSCILKNIPCLYASEKGFCPFGFGYCAEEEYWKKKSGRSGRRDGMNEKQNNLNDYLNDLCAFMYDSDKNEMLLDLLVVIGNWSEFELREDQET